MGRTGFGRLAVVVWVVAAATGWASCASPEPEPPVTAVAEGERSGETPETRAERSASGGPRPWFERFTVAEGLVGGIVDGILQDRQGFLWVGTWNGLHRYDGATFTPFLHDPADAGSIASPWVWELYEDRDGYLWVGTEAGLSRFDPATETFTNYRHDPDDPTSLSRGAARSLAEDARGVLWIGTVGGGLSRFHPETETFTSFYFEPDSSKPKAVYALVAAPNGTLWVGANWGLYRFDPATETFTPSEGGAGAAVGAVPPDVFALEVSRSGALWVGSRDDGLFRRDPATGAFTHYPADPSDARALGHRWVLSLLEDADGVLWAGTDGGGLHRYDPTTDDFDRYVYDPGDAQSLTDDRVLSLFEDRAGVLWVGTYEGLHRRYPLSRVLAYDRHRPGDAASPSPNRILAFVEDRAGALWVGTDGGGVGRRDPVTGRFKHYPLGRGTFDRSVATSLAEDERGGVWVGTYAGIDRWDPETDRFAPFRAANGEGSDWTPSVTSQLAMGRDRMWAATFDGLLSIDPQTERYVRYVPDPDDPGLDYTALLAVLPDAAGDVWVAGFDGIFGRLDPETGAFAHRYDRTGLGAERWGQAVGIHRDRSGTLWAGTSEAGLVRMSGERLLEAERLEESEGLEITQYGLAEGLPSQGASGVIGDAAGHLWITTSQGISRFDVETETFHHYGHSDGLQSGEAMHRSPHTGRVYISATQGYYAFDPADLAPAAPPAPLVLTGLRLLNEESRIGAEGSPLDRPLWMTDALRLDYDDRVLTFEFAALDFRAPAAHRYAVRLDGFDEAWREVGDRREATFTNLSPGSYTLRVRAAGRDGLWGEETTLAMTIVPPWWRAWWAWLAYALLAVGLLTVAYRARRRRHELQHRMEMEQLEADKLRELDEARSRFFANVSHEFRTPLTLTLGPLDDMKAGVYGPLDAPLVQQVDLARRNARRVLDLINQILDVARLESGRTPLHAGPLDLGAFVAAVAEPFRGLAERKALTFEVDRPAIPLEVFADPAQLEKAIANLLSNALKFTPEGGTVRVDVRTWGGRDEGPHSSTSKRPTAPASTPDRAAISVRDSGPGIPAADVAHIFDRFYQVDASRQTQLGSGIGLALAKEVVDLHRGTLGVESEEGFGSTFTVTLPLGHAHLAPEQIVADEPWVPEGSPRYGASLLSEPGGDGRADEAPPFREETAEDDVTTVLVVEDHPEVRAYVRRHLEAPGADGRVYRVIEAGDGEEGLALAKARLPDLVISDVMMPKLDGLGLCRALKADAATDFIPVILLTAKAAPEDKLEGLGEHCDDYLTKPFDPAELRARIDNLIAVRTRLRARFQQEGVALARVDAAPVPLRLPAPEDVTSADDAFLEQVREAVEAHLSDETFSVERLAEAVGMSRGHLHRQLKALVGQTPSDLIRTLRLERATHLLAGRAGTVSEIAYAVGFKSVAYFSDSFVRAYGCRPSEYATRAGMVADGETASDDTASDDTA